MVHCIKTNVTNVIEEINAAYHSFSDYNYMNADYADFAGMALGQFRNALRNQDLTREQLESLLRKGISQHRTTGKTGSSWTTFVASYIATSSNTNHVTDL